jgi:quercetin dioxygenase-like cupin family protein
MRATTDHEVSTLQAETRRSLDEALCPRRPDDEALLARVKQRVLTAVTEKTAALHGTVRAEAGEWERVSLGVERKLLWESHDAMSCLLRLAPGAMVGAHAHPIDEECIVLEGSIRIGSELLLKVGDFHVGVQGVAHEAATSETGALVYLRAAKPGRELVGSARH